MHAILFYLALLPWANGQSTSTSSSSRSFSTPLANPTIALQSPGTLVSCGTVNITWAASGVTRLSNPLTINYTNEGAGGTVVKVISGVAAVVTDPLVQVALWRVNVPTNGQYILTGSAGGISITPSLPFTVVVLDTSCFSSTTTATAAPGITTTSPVSLGSPSNSPSAPLNASTTSLAGNDPSEVPIGGNGNGPKVANMVGGIFGSVTFVALLAALFFYRRNRSLKTRTLANSKPEKPKGHGRWGDLSSVDNTVVLGGISTVTPTGPGYANPRGKSVNHFDDGFEKGTPPLYEEEGPADDVPTPSLRSRSRYSSGALRAALARQDSGLAAFNNERARTASSGGASPAISLVENPFDNSPRMRGERSKSLSLLSTSHPSPQSLSVPTLSPPLTLEAPGSPRVSENDGLDSSMRRSKSATASTRPTRKPVPQYDPPIEMTTTFSSYSQHSAKDSVTNFTSDSHTMLGSSVDSTSPWLVDRAPSVNRNIGLAFQGDGPVHYLTPDLPPPPRD